MTCFCADVVVFVDVIVWPYELALPAVLAEALDLVTIAASVLADPLTLEARFVVSDFFVEPLAIDFDLSKTFAPLPITDSRLAAVSVFVCLPLSVLALDSSDSLPRFLLEPALSLSAV
jgi:hypothetical protein